MELGVPCCQIVRVSPNRLKDYQVPYILEIGGIPSSRRSEGVELDAWKENFMISYFIGYIFKVLEFILKLGRLYDRILQAASLAETIKPEMDTKIRGSYG